MASERHLEETAKQPEGISVNFTNSEALRAFILSPEKPGKTTLAERIAGIREIPLGEFRLDGQLFQSVGFTLVVEPDRDPRGQRPTAIIRADLALGPADTALAQFQATKARGERPESYLDWDGKLAQKTKKIFPGQENIDDDQAYLSYVQWTNNTSRFSLYRNSELLRDIDDKMPLALLQIWDQDAGYGSISMSLLSWRYAKEWGNRSLQNQAAELERQIAKGSVSGDYREPVMDEVDRWQFTQPVGIDVYDPQRFAAALAFYQEAIVGTIQAIYQTEGLTAPSLRLEIEPPLVFKDEEQVTFAEIGGQKMAVMFLKSLADAEKHGQRLIDQALLLSGPAGNGKTKMTKALASELGAPMVVKTTNDLPPKFTDADVISLLEAGFWEAKATARRGGGKAVYCLEQIEVFLGQQDEHGRLHDFLMNTIDEWVQDKEVVLVLTSNNPERLHEGIPSRCQRVDVPLLGREGVIETLQIWADKLVKLTGQRDVFGDVDWDEIAFRMMRSSGRDLKHFLSKAYYLREVQSRLGGHWLPIDTEFLVVVAQKRTPNI